MKRIEEMRINIIICLLAITIFFGIAETVLQLFWKNPYNGTSTDVVIKLGFLHKNMNQQLNRKLIDSKVSEVLYRTNNPLCQYSFPYDNIDMFGSVSNQHL